MFGLKHDYYLYNYHTFLKNIVIEKLVWKIIEKQ